MIAGLDDHISPWPSAYRATQLLRGDIKFVLSNSGRIAAMVNPPTNPKATFRVGNGQPPDHRDWLAKAETRQGSWWPDYTGWLESRSGGTKQAPKTLGSAKYPPLDPRQGSTSWSGSPRQEMRPGTGETRCRAALCASPRLAAGHLYRRLWAGHSVGRSSLDKPDRPRPG